VALGSSPREILRSTTAEGLGPVAIGLAAGVAGAWAGSRVLSSFLFEVGPADPVTYAIAAAVFVAVACAAWWIPARRATRIDPMVILREE
jgi:putative ABC transport system permease protein